MEDGVILFADLYKANQPEGPVILIRTPYQKEGMEIIAKHFSSKGYYVIVQDVRGKYASEGTFVPFLREKSDGESTLKWIENQPWSDGNVGLWGSSYLGYSALSLSASANPVLKSIFHLSGWLDGTQVNTPGGAFHQSLIIPWLVFEGQKTRVNISKMDMYELLEYVPTEEIIPSMYFRLEDGDSIHMSQVSVSNNEFPFEQSKVSIFHLTGWYDFVLQGVIDVHQRFKRFNSGPQFLKIGPWFHNQAYGGASNTGELELSESGLINIEELMTLSLKWFDHTLKGQESTKLLPVEYFVLFENVWKTADEWPPKLSSDESLYLSLSRIEHSISKNGKSEFIYDPNQPVPTWGGANFHFFMDEMGMREQTKIESREDVICFTSSVFTQPKRFVGPVSVDLYFKTDAIGTDFTAKLTVVDSLGNSHNVSDGIVRLQPNQTKGIQKTSIHLNDIAFLVKKGEQIRLQISSSNFPKFNRNPNTGVHPLEAKEFKISKQTIYYGKEHPSKINLRVLEE